MIISGLFKRHKGNRLSRITCKNCGDTFNENYDGFICEKLNEDLIATYWFVCYDCISKCTVAFITEDKLTKAVPWVIDEIPF